MTTERKRLVRGPPRRFGRAVVVAMIGLFALTAGTAVGVGSRPALVQQKI
jgi:hypothetical protein